MPNEPPRLRQTFIRAEAWLVSAALMPTKAAACTGTNRNGSGNSCQVRARAACKKSMSVARWVMFQKPNASNARAPPIRIRRSTLFDSTPATGISARVARPPSVMARPALVAV